MTDNMRKWQMVPISRVIFLFAFLLLCDRVDGVVKQAELRSTSKIRYDGFVYGEKDWLKGVVIQVSDEALVLAAPKDVLNVPLATITAIRVRLSKYDPWESVQGPFNESTRLRAELIQSGALIAKASSVTSEPEIYVAPPQVKKESESTEDQLAVSHVEESGVDVLVLYADVGATINDTERKRYGIFPNIQNFVSAQYIRRLNGTYAVRLKTFDESGVMHESEKNVAYAGILALQKRVKPANKTTQAPRQKIVQKKDKLIPKNTQRKDMYYAGLGVHYVLGSQATEYFNDRYSLKLDGRNERARQVGFMTSIKRGRYIDLSFATYTLRDMGSNSGNPYMVSYRVRSLELSTHYYLTGDGWGKGLSIIFGYGIAMNQSEFRADGSVYSDEWNGYPWSVGLRHIADMGTTSFSWFVDGRFRSHGAVVGESKRSLELGGWFLQSGIIFAH